MRNHFITTNDSKQASVDGWWLLPVLVVAADLDGLEVNSGCAPALVSPGASAATGNPPDADLGSSSLLGFSFGTDSTWECLKEDPFSSWILSMSRARQARTSQDPKPGYKI